MTVPSLVGHGVRRELPQLTTVPSFFSVPRELRDMIYHFVIGEKGEYCQSQERHVWVQDLECHTIIHTSDRWRSCDRFNIARTCRIVNAEANQVIYRKNKFRFQVMMRTWLKPRISQNNADLMQNIHIALGSNKEKRTRSVHFLQRFAFSQVVRQRCRIESALDSPKHIKIMRPIFQVLARLTAFEVVIVEMTGEKGSFRHWDNSEYAPAKYLWERMRKNLELALGTATSTCSPKFRYLEFKPQEYLAQKSLSR